jgi:anaerobic selenocysteine-containing dehydrogenase
VDNKIFRTICQLCHTNCGLVVRRNVNGDISIKGDHDHPMNRGQCCRKAAANAEIIHSSERLKHPLWKSSSGFKRVSWDEALTIAAEKLGETRSKFGPLSLALCTGAPVSYRARDGFLQFMGEFGSPNHTGIANLCMVPRMIAFKAVTGCVRAEPDYDRTKLVLFWGSNPLGAERFSSYAAHNGLKTILSRLKQREVRTICIDPFRTQTVEATDEWVRVNPGSDTALGLAMIHVIIEEELYDKEFVIAHTFGCKELTQHVKGCHPAWAENLTGIPAGAIGELARSYATARPAIIYEGNGLDMYTNGVDAVRTIAILIALTGNLDTPGGNVFMPTSHASPLPTRPLVKERRVGHDQFPLLPQVPFSAMKEAILHEEDNRPRAMIVHHGNPVLVQANETRTRQALEKLDFLIAIDIFPTATTEMADLILPDASYFESYGYRAYTSAEGSFLALGRPIVGPVGEARSVFEIEYELARKMGLHQNYPFQDDRSWIDYMIRPNGVTFQRLEAEQIVYTSKEVEYHKYINKAFETPSGKVEFYSQGFLKVGADPMPVYAEPAGEPLTKEAASGKSFSLLGTSRKPTQFVHTKFRNLAVISKSYPEPLVYIHPQDASKRDIHQGDDVDVTSPRGKITLKAKISKDTECGLVTIDFGWGNPSDGKANINVLTNDQHFDPVSGGTPNRLFSCEVKLSQSRVNTQRFYELL